MEGKHAVLSDFSKGSIQKNILRLALPITGAQFVNLLYNIVDRIYIGRIAGNSGLALTGLGVCFPLITLIIAFANLIGIGGSTLFSMERGRGNREEAEKTLGISFLLLLFTGLILTGLLFVLRRPLLLLLGAGERSYGYADQYFSIYLIGTVFVMLSLGMNAFINAQGFARTGLFTVLIGAVLNIILDPVFIFLLDMGIRGAAIATVISQAASFLWTLQFLLRKDIPHRLSKPSLRAEGKRIRTILSYGAANFMMAFTNSAVQAVCNITLQTFGGDLYVAVMTIIQSIRDTVSMPMSGFSSASQPVISFHGGARLYKRIKEAVRYLTLVTVLYLLVAWALIFFFPDVFLGIFTNKESILHAARVPTRVYFLGFCFMSLQFVGQSTFTAMGFAKQAVFFSIFRKGILVIPLTLLFSYGFHMGVYGVFLAEPISNLIGGFASYLAMIQIVYRRLPEDGEPFL